VLYIRPWRTSIETRNKQLRNNLLDAKSLSSLGYLAICENRIFIAVVTRDSRRVFVQSLMNSAQSFSPSFFGIYFNHLNTPIFHLGTGIETVYDSYPIHAVYMLCSCTDYLLTPWSRALLEKLTGSAASQEIPRIFGTRRFITVLTSARQLSLS